MSASISTSDNGGTMNRTHLRQALVLPLLAVLAIGLLAAPPSHARVAERPDSSAAAERAATTYKVSITTLCRQFAIKNYGSTCARGTASSGGALKSYGMRNDGPGIRNILRTDRTSCTSLHLSFWMGGVKGRSVIKITTNYGTKRATTTRSNSVDIASRVNRSFRLAAGIDTFSDVTVFLSGYGTCRTKNGVR